jgi:superfamily I DNA/RNA helicase
MRADPTQGFVWDVYGHALAPLDYLLVDEAQDLSPVQLDMMRMVSERRSVVLGTGAGHAPVAIQPQTVVFVGEWSCAWRRDGAGGGAGSGGAMCRVPA